MTLLQLFGITASLLGLAVAGAAAQPAPAPTPAQTRHAKHHARIACRREAAIVVPVLRTEQDEMNRLLYYSVCVEKRGYPMGNRHRHR
jgi:hypothetical protein